MQQLRWLLGGGLILLSIATVIYLEVNAWAVSLLAVAGTAGGLARPDWPARVPPLLHKLAFPAIVAFFLGDLWLNAEILPAMVRLDILLLGYRGVTYRQRRDDLQVVVLGLFLVVVAGVLTVSITFAAQILAFVGCALGLLLVLTLTDAMRVVARPAVAEKFVVPAWAQALDWRLLLGRVRRATDARVVAAGLVLFAGVVGVAVFLFLAIPRFQLDNSLFLERFILRKARTGFNDTIRIGDVTEISQDTSIALSVDVTDKSAVPAQPYWRMMVLDEYNEGSFRLSARLRQWGNFQGWQGNRFAAGEAHRGAPPVTWTFFLEPGVSRVLPFLGQFELLLFRERQNYHASKRLQIVEIDNEPAAMTAYQIETMDTGPVLGDPAFAGQWRRVAEHQESMAAVNATAPAQIGFPRLAPGDFAALQAAAAEVQALEPAANWPKLVALNRGPKHVTAAQQFAQKAVIWLRRRHHYALAPTYPRHTGDPLIAWLASRSSGHCELFAGSVVMLARASGYPARVITGFKGGTWNSYSNNLTIRNSDAHAWAEVFDLENGGWLRVDALAEPETGADAVLAASQAQAARTDASWTARLESLRVFWYRRIVSFDQQSQVETIQAVKGATENLGARLRAALAEGTRRVAAWVRGPWDAPRLLRVLAGLGGAVLLGWIGVQVARRAGPRLGRAGGRRRTDPVRREAGRWLHRFDPARRHPAADRVRPSLERLRYGAPSTWPDPAGTFREARAAWRATRRR